MPVGSNTSRNDAAVTNISPSGFWILDAGANKEYFVDFTDYPMFADATVKQITAMRTDMCGDFHWDALDIDIEALSLVSHEQYSLCYKR